MQRHIPIPDIAPPVALALEPKVAFPVGTEVDGIVHEIEVAHLASGNLLVPTH